MFGYHADEIVGRHFEVLFTPEDRAAGLAAAELKTALESGRAADERFHVRKNGTRFYCSGVTTRLGEALGFAKIARDLSIQQQALDALKVVEAEFDQRMHERTDRLKAEVQSRAQAHSTVSDLLKRIITAQEDERARIARDLHDQLGQQLTALRLTLEQYRDRQAMGDAIAPEVERALHLVNEVDREVDFLAWEIRPAVLDDLGLAAALPRYLKEWSAHYGVAAEYREQGLRSGQISKEAEVVFYRVAQESLNNVTKHAHASRVDVLLESRDGSIVLVVEDDGIGFDPGDVAAGARGIGLAGMRERAAVIGGELQIESAPGDGTSIFLRCPTILAAAGKDVKQA
jgi:signal transduction histidine kinase